MIYEQHGKIQHTHANAAAGSTVQVDCYGFNALIVWHEMTGVTSGGYVTIENRYEQGTSGIAHPAPAGDSQYGANVKNADETDGYVSIYRGVSRYVGIVLNATDGTHDVRVLPVNL